MNQIISFQNEKDNQARSSLWNRISEIIAALRNNLKIAPPPLKILILSSRIIDWGKKQQYSCSAQLSKKDKKIPIDLFFNTLNKSNIWALLLYTFIWWYLITEIMTQIIAEKINAYLTGTTPSNALFIKWIFKKLPTNDMYST